LLDVRNLAYVLQHCYRSLWRTFCGSRSN